MQRAPRKGGLGDCETSHLALVGNDDHAPPRQRSRLPGLLPMWETLLLYEDERARGFKTTPALVQHRTWLGSFTILHQGQHGGCHGPVEVGLCVRAPGEDEATRGLKLASELQLQR